MSKSALQKLRRLGFQFWSLKPLTKVEPENEEIFFLLDQDIVIAGHSKEFRSFPRFLPSICLILGTNSQDLVVISRKEAREKNLSLLIYFLKDNKSFKSKKIFKFHSLSFLLSNPKLKQNLYSDLTK